MLKISVELTGNANIIFAIGDTCLCSGGNKRKLSTAIALVGSPLIVFLVCNSVTADCYIRDFLG